MIHGVVESIGHGIVRGCGPSTRSIANGEIAGLKQPQVMTL